MKISLRAAGLIRHFRGMMAMTDDIDEIVPALKFKPKNRRVRIIYSDDPGGVDSVQKNPGKVFAVVGPFNDHTEKQDLMDALEIVLRGYNLEQT